MKFREITINDKSLFEGFDYVCSDYVFSCLYMYSETFDIKLFEDDKTIIIYSNVPKPSFYMPLGDTEYGIKKVIEYCKSNNMQTIFSEIPESHIQIFKDFSFILQEDRDTFDYIFRNTDLSEFQGKNYRNQRNNLSSFLKAFNPSYTENIYDNIEKCKEFTLKHYREFDIVNPTLRILDSMKYFDCKGGIVWDGGEIQAFCIYEKISPDTVLSHVELTNNIHRGVHAFLIKEMSSRIKEEYINKEDDVGLPGLRKYKESYNPCFMLKKYIAYPC